MYSLKEVSEMLNVNPETLRRWDNKGYLKAVRVGPRGDRKYVASEVDAWIKAIARGEDPNAKKF